MMSEASYIFFSLLSIWLVMTETKRSPYKSPGFYVMILSVGFLWHIRTQGIALMVAILVFYLFKKKWHHATFFGGLSTLLVLPWLFRNHYHDLAASRYLRQIMLKNHWRPEEGNLDFLELVARFFETWKMLILKALPDSLFNFIFHQQNNVYSFKLWIIALLVLFILGIGISVKMKRHSALFVSYIFLNFSIVGLWSAPGYNRYIVVIIPILLIGFYAGLIYLLERLFKKLNAHPAILLSLLVIFCIAQIPGIKTLKTEHRKKMQPNVSNYLRMGVFIREKFPKGNIVVCSRKPTLFYFYAGSYGCKYPYTSNPKEMLQGLIDKDVDYVVVEQLGYASTKKYLVPAIKAYPQFFQIVKQLKHPNTYLFRFRKSDELIVNFLNPVFQSED